MIADTTDCTRENNLKEITQPDKTGDEAKQKCQETVFGSPRVAASPTKTKTKSEQTQTTTAPATTRREKIHFQFV